MDLFPAAFQIDDIGDKNDRALKPNKLAAFYKAVGGDYDSKSGGALPKPYLNMSRPRPARRENVC